MSASSFVRARLVDLLSPSEEWIQVDPEQTYREVTVKLWGKGVVLRREVPGSDFAGARRKIVRKRQFILSRIDARNGASGIVPESLEGAIVTNDFPVFEPKGDRLLPEYLGLMSRTDWFVDLCKRASEGTTNRVRLKEDRFLSMEVPLPSIKDQQRIVQIVGSLTADITAARKLRAASRAEFRALSLSAYESIVRDAPYQSMCDVAPLCRRPIVTDASSTYHELGIRSFGKGTFHKPPVEGDALGEKRLFKIQAGDLLFNIVFAWEGAVAVARAEDDGRVGSHRFLTCVPRPTLATAQFLRFHFLTSAGLDCLGRASPGGAGRNRTLGLNALATISVPVPRIEKQVWFDELQARVESATKLQDSTDAEIESLVPAMIHQEVARGL
jgi:type I restriction enzyme S subunit